MTMQPGIENDMFIGCDADLKERWITIVAILDYAFQPIVNIHTGSCHGYEALLRRNQDAGFVTIDAVFNAAYEDGVLVDFDLLLRRKAIRKFQELPFHGKMKLFYNIDNRILTETSFSPLVASSFMQNTDMYPGSFVTEISERHDTNMHILNDIQSLHDIKVVLKNFRKDLFKFAIDDFGSGLSGLQLLYHSEPDYIKIDRFFITDISSDSRKKLFVTSTVKMAHILGILVIAEGLETPEEFYSCAQLGCDYVQGYLVQRPTTDLSEIKEKYSIVPDLYQRDKRKPGTDHDMIRSQLEYITPINLHSEEQEFTQMEDVFETFRRNKKNSFFPVINANDEPIGVIREKDLKEYVYSPYGRDILKNKTSGNIMNFVSRIPISEIRTKVENILEGFSLDSESEGTLLTENGAYVGFLSASSLIRLLNEKNLDEARDQNPLTKLPGNNIINRYISEGIEDRENEYVFVYFDFDNFKPFNDKYGFRQGDRAILMFADILRETANKNRCFIGHIGGDDFFSGFRLADINREEITYIIHEIISRFKSDVVSIYDTKDRNNGYIISTDREGTRKKFPLLGVSAGVLDIPRGQRFFTMEELFTILAELKKQAKKSTESSVSLTLNVQVQTNVVPPADAEGQRPSGQFILSNGRYIRSS